MKFIARISEKIWDIGEWFWDAYKAIKDEWWCPQILADALYEIQRYFGRLAYDIDDFGDWVDEVWAKVPDISWANIRSLIRSWLPNLEDAIAWWQDWVTWVDHEVFDFFIDTIYPIIVGYLYTLREWIGAESNSLKDWVRTTVADIGDIGGTIINNITEYITQVVTNIYDYSQTIVNNITEYITQAVTNIYDYSVTTFNNITQVITEVLDWDRVTKFLNDWWKDRLIDITDLTNTKLKEWFPFYDDLASLWDGIAEFFSDPLQWVYNKLDEFFERFW